MTSNAIPFGRYELLERIGGGGMAEVFKARSSGVGGFEKIIAIKRILPNLVSDSEFVSLFVKEAKISASLSHANIAQVFEFGQIDGTYFIAMEYIHGRDLKMILKQFRAQSTAIPIALSVHIALSVCSALAHAHRKTVGGSVGIIHRDVSPPNVLISYEGAVKLIDFGIAKAKMRSSEVTGNLVGNIGYMSPEQAGGRPVDARTDIFALGSILYECVTGYPLFDADSDLGLLEKVRFGKFAPPRSYNPKIPISLEQILLKALNFDPNQRYQDAEELRRGLEEFIQQTRLNFTNKQLSKWMKTTFATDFANEQSSSQLANQIIRPEQLAQAMPSSTMPPTAQLRGPVNQANGERRGTMAMPTIAEEAEILGQAPSLSAPSGGIQPTLSGTAPDPMAFFQKNDKPKASNETFSFASAMRPTKPMPEQSNQGFNSFAPQASFGDIEEDELESDGATEVQSDGLLEALTQQTEADSSAPNAMNASPSLPSAASFPSSLPSSTPEPSHNRSIPMPASLRSLKSIGGAQMPAPAPQAIPSPVVNDSFGSLAPSSGFGDISDNELDDAGDTEVGSVETFEALGLSNSIATAEKADAADSFGLSGQSTAVSDSEQENAFRQAFGGDQKEFITTGADLSSESKSAKGFAGGLSNDELGTFVGNDSTVMEGEVEYQEDLYSMEGSEEEHTVSKLPEDWKAPVKESVSNEVVVPWQSVQSGMQNVDTSALNDVATAAREGHSGAIQTLMTEDLLEDDLVGFEEEVATEAHLREGFSFANKKAPNVGSGADLGQAKLPSPMSAPSMGNASFSPADPDPDNQSNHVPAPLPPPQIQSSVPPTGYMPPPSAPLAGPERMNAPSMGIPSGVLQSGDTPAPIVSEAQNQLTPAPIFSSESHPYDGADAHDQQSGLLANSLNEAPAALSQAQSSAYVLSPFAGEQTGAPKKGIPWIWVLIIGGLSLFVITVIIGLVVALSSSEPNEEVLDESSQVKKEESLKSLESREESSSKKSTSDLKENENDKEGELKKESKEDSNEEANAGNSDPKASADVDDSKELEDKVKKDPATDKVVKRTVRRRRVRRPRRRARTTRRSTKKSSKKGSLIITSRPRAKVYIDGRYTRRTTPIRPSNPLKLSTGKHTVMLVVGRKRFRYRVTIKANSMARLVKRLPL